MHGSVSACWRRVVIAISRENTWNSGLFSCGGSLALASPSQSVIHAALVVLILFAACIGWLCLERRFSDIWRVVWSLVLCAGIAFGLAGVAMLPNVHCYWRDDPAHRSSAAVIGHAHIPWENFNLTQLKLNQADRYSNQTDLDHIVGSPYVGPLGVIGTLLAGIYFGRLALFSDPGPGIWSYRFVWIVFQLWN